MTMHETLTLLNQHVSCRSYTDTPVADAELDAILLAGQRAATSVNGQQISAIVIKDAGRRAQLAHLAGDQPWVARAPIFIVLAVDFYKTHLGVARAGRTQVSHRTMEGLLVGATDGGIVLASMMTAARALGLGVVAIGGIRGEAEQVHALLQLPDMCFPLVGLCIGHIKTAPHLKPRLPMATFRHDEHYHKEGLEAAIATYDQTLMAHWQKLGRADGAPWSETVADYYDHSSRPHLREFLARQGFAAE